MKSVRIILPLLLLVFTSPAFGADELEVFDDELHPRLEDATQQGLTTGVNWSGLEARSPAHTVFSTPPYPGASVEPALRETMRPRALRILIDAGHGGKDLGAKGHFGIWEKDLCLKIGKLVKQSLEKRLKGRDVEVRLSRESDLYLTLKDRVRLANSWEADLFVSIHANSSPAIKAQGFEVYFLSPEASDAAAKRLARIENEGHSTEVLRADVLSILSDVQTTQHVSESSHFAEKVFQIMSRGLKANGRGVRQAPFTVLAGTSMPALLVEVGYVTNRDEARNLARARYLKRLAGAISSGIIEFATHIRRLG